MLAIGLLVGCGGVDESQGEQTEVAVPALTTGPERTVDAMWPPPQPPSCFEYNGAACSNKGARFDCILQWTEPGMCYCNGSYWQCS